MANFDYQNPLFKKACLLTPIYERDEMKRRFGDKYNEIQLCVMRAKARFDNPICNTCLSAPPKVDLKRCNCCGLVTYCSKKCQQIQLSRHKKWVATLPDAAPWALDPMALTDVSEKLLTL